LVLCALFAEIAVSVVVSQELLSRPISYSDAISETFSQKWLYGIGQAILKSLILIGGIIVIAIFLGILAALSQALMGLMMVLIILILIPFFIYLTIKWYFSLTAVAVEDIGVTDSLRKSWNLVDGHWWRTFGILFLLTIIAQLIVLIVSSPIIFAFMWDFYKEYFQSFGATGGNIDPETSRQVMRNMGPGMGISIGISPLISLLITPVFTVVMYYDLRARNNEFPQPKEEIIMDDQSQQTIDLGQM